jgi:hypothetical protein
MKSWFTSLSGAVTFSALSLLSFIGYIFLMSRYFLEKWIPGDSAAAIETIGVLIIVGLWLRALFVAASDRRSGLVTLFAFSAFTTLVALYDLPHPGPWPSMIIVVSTLVFSVLAIAALVLQLSQKKKAG